MLHHQLLWDRGADKYTRAERMLLQYNVLENVQEFYR